MSADEWRLIEPGMPAGKVLLGAVPGAVLVFRAQGLSIQEMPGAVAEGVAHYSLEEGRMLCVTAAGVVDGYTHWLPKPAPPAA